MTRKTEGSAELSVAAFDTVAPGVTSNLTACRNAHLSSSGERQEPNPSAALSLPGLKNLFEPWCSHGFKRYHRAKGAPIALARRDAVSTLQASALDDVLTVSGAHSDSKSVRLELMAVIRLVRSLHETVLILNGIAMERRGYPAFLGSV